MGTTTENTNLIEEEAAKFKLKIQFLSFLFEQKTIPVNFTCLKPVKTGLEGIIFIMISKSLIIQNGSYVKYLL